MTMLSRLCLAVAVARASRAAQPARSAGAPAPTNVKAAAAAPGHPAGQQRAGVARGAQRASRHYTSSPGPRDRRADPAAARSCRASTLARLAQFRNGPVTFYGGWLVVLILAAILGFYFAFGPVKLHEPPTGRLIRASARLEQVVHWSVAISFCMLGLSGLIMFFGKHVLLPVIGYTLFGWLTALPRTCTTSSRRSSSSRWSP